MGIIVRDNEGHDIDWSICACTVHVHLDNPRCKDHPTMPKWLREICDEDPDLR